MVRALYREMKRQAVRKVERVSSGMDKRERVGEREGGGRGREGGREGGRERGG